MSKSALAVLSLCLLAACGRQDQAIAQNAQNGAAAEANAIGNSSSSDPGRTDAPDNGATEPVPPPDAVSHPDGYLPPAPGEPDPASSNSSGSDDSPPATEDQHIRNGQAGR